MKDSRFGSWVGANKWRFILVHGVIGWGLLCACLMSLWDYVSGETISPTTFVVFPLGGIGFGWFMWRGAERRRKAALTERTDAN